MSSRKICAYQDRLIPEADERSGHLEEDKVKEGEGEGGGEEEEEEAKGQM